MQEDGARDRSKGYRMILLKGFVRKMVSMFVKNQLTENEYKL